MMMDCELNSYQTGHVIEIKKRWRTRRYNKMPSYDSTAPNEELPIGFSPEQLMSRRFE